MKIIYLTRGLLTLVDNEDFKALSRVAWTAKHNGLNPGKWYAWNGNLGYMHRFILKTPDDLFGDHKNGCGLDNRRENLRSIPFGHNVQNAPARSASGFKGVRETKSGKFLAYIRKNYTQTRLGIYESPEDAARAYDVAALEMFGTDAALNFSVSQ